MKYILFCIITLFSSSAIADEPTKEQKKINKTIDKVLKCAREAIDERREGVNSIDLALRYLQDAKDHQTDIEYLKDLKKQCKDERRSMDRDRVDWDLMWERLAANSGSYAKGVEDVVVHFIAPKTVCKLGGIKAELALGISFGGGVLFGKCKSDNGKRSLVAVPQGSLGLGGGAMILLEKKTLVLYGRGKKYNATSLGAGVLVAGDISFPRGESASLGLGLGINFKEETGIKLKFLPLRSKMDGVREMLLSEE